MRQVDIIRILDRSNRMLFSLADLKKLLHLKDSTVYVQLNRFTNAGLITRLKRDVYCLDIDKVNNFELANFLYKPSYISLESALVYYGILLQVPQVVISVTPRRSTHLKVGGKEFVYLHIDQRYYFGYEQNDKLLFAGREKAIIDTVFFASFGRASFDCEEWILNDIDIMRLKQFASKIKSPVFHKLLSKVMK